MTQRSETNRKSQRINVRLTLDELIAVHAEAKRRGLSLSDFAREQLFTKPTRKRARVAVMAGIDPDLWMQVRRVGVNLNQIAHRLNSQEIALVPAELPDLLDQIRDLLKLPVVKKT